MHLSLRTSRVLLTSFLTLLLIACGGGGTGSPLDNNNPAGGSGVVNADSTFLATGPAGVALSAIDLSFTESTTITIQILDESGGPISGQDVFFSFEVAETVPTVSQELIVSGTVFTDANGNADIPLSIDDPSVAGTGTLTITASGFGAEFIIDVVTVADVPAVIDLELVDVETGLPVTGIDFTNGARVNITITEGDGSALSIPLMVTAASTAGMVSPSDVLINGGTGNFIISRTAGISDFSAVEITVSADAVGANDAVIVVSGSLLSQFLPDDTVGGAAGVPSSLQPIPFIQDPDNPGVPISAISAQDPGELVVTVLDLNDDPVANTIVSVQTDLGDLSPTLGNVLTDINGRATIGLAVGDGEPGAAGTLSISVGDDLQFSTNFEIVDAGTTSSSGLSLSLQLFNSIDGTAATSINSVEPGLLRVTLTNVISGDPVPGEVITVSSEFGDPTFSPASGEILTDANGQAELIVNVGNSEPGAAIGLLADLEDLFAEIQFFVSDLDIELGRDPDGDYAAINTGTFVLNQIDVDNAGNSSVNLAANGSTTLRVAAFDMDDATLFTSPLTVNFVSSCAEASIDTGVTTVSGVATASFTSVAACEGVVTVTASVVELPSVTATGTINVSPPAGVPTDISLELVDVITGLPVTGIDFSNGARVEVTVREAGGALLSVPLIVDASTVAGTVTPEQVLISGGTGDFIISRTDGLADFLAVEITASAEVLDSNGQSQTISSTLLSEFLPNNNVGGGGVGVAAALSPTPFLQDPDNPGVAITAISAEDPGELVVTVVDANSDPVENAIVSVQTDLGILSPALGNVLTDVNGQATIALSVGDAESGAAGTLSINVGDDLQFTTNFEIVDTGTTSNSGLSLSLQLFNSTDGTASTTINSVEPGRLVATLTNVISGLPVPGEIIDISIVAGDPVLTPDSGQVLTGVNGQAEVLVGVGTSQAGAAISLLAQVSDLESSIQFSVGNADIQLGRDPDGDYSTIDAGTFVQGEIDVDAMGGNTISLSATGTAILRVGVLDVGAGELFDTPLTVNFESNCGAASIDTGVTTVNGVASSTFVSSAACEGDVTVTASLVEISGATATGSIIVAGSTANSIEFESATPTDIAIQGTGGAGRQETSELVFQVIDDGGEPRQGETVNFQLSTTLGGISLTSSSAISNDQGLVTAIVSSGTVPTPVQVIATLNVDPDGIASNGDEFEVSTVSDTLVVSTGLPDQNSFSLSANVLNPGGGDLDGIQSEIVIRASDAFNNPVPDGTAITFMTEYGSIGSSCTTMDGSCSVTWESQNPRAPIIASTGTVRTINNTACDFDNNGPANDTTGVPCFDGVNAFPLGQIFAGRTTIMAFALGDESFVDSNGNGFYDFIDVNSNDLFDIGTDILEPFVDLPEAFVDHNEDGVFGSQISIFDNNGDGACIADDGRDQCAGFDTGGAEETFIDLDADSAYDGDQDGDTGNNSVGNGIYNGVLCSDELEILNLCTSDLVNVRDEVVLLMSGSTPVIDIRSSANNFPITSIDVSALPQTVMIWVSDFQNGYIASGSSITITSDNCDIAGDGTFTVINTNAAGFTRIPLGLSEDDGVNGISGSVTVTVNSNIEAAGGDTFEVESSRSFTCIDAN